MPRSGFSNPRLVMALSGLVMTLSGLAIALSFSNSTRRHGHLLVCGQTRCPPTPNHGAGSAIRLVTHRHIHSERPLQKLLTACRSSMAPGRSASAMTSRSPRCSAVWRCGWPWWAKTVACSVAVVKARNDNKTDQQQRRDSGNPTPHAADVLIAADRRETRIIHHGTLLGSERFGRETR